MPTHGSPLVNVDPKARRKLLQEGAQKVRTAIVLVVAVLISIVGTVVLDGIAEPTDFKPALRGALATDPHAQVAPETMEKVRRAANITVYVADPMAGLFVGLFVGLVQKRRPIICALIAVLPNFFIELTPTNMGDWPTSASGITHYLVGRSLPFIAAAAGVVSIRNLRRCRTSAEVQP